ncbi:predicted protein [Bathycoccus prasinos]|uniref:No exine formation 1 n=1 Tax=Bathycoccus prasinos TaxID=41875 RepID=K8F4D7_9CHLO|nr:predicted protein [Bathycoccus prasinos]CCO16373.1 predicted protein [Bathycoccus prasinos]|eukprot:XP_007513848.1 predicted protein [Bathycoccus prasinos]
MNSRITTTRRTTNDVFNNKNNNKNSSSSLYAFSLLPCILMLLGAGEDGIFTTLLIGCAASYILDLLRYPEMTLVCVWLALFSIYLAMLIESDLFFAPLRPTIISLFLLTTNGIMLFLCGLWASLQFKWVEMEHPNVSRWMESVLVASILPVCGALIGWTLMASVGAVLAPFYLQIVLMVLYHLLYDDDGKKSSPPSSSRGRRQRGGSFKGVSGAPGERSLTSREKYIHKFCVCFCPAFVYVGTHWPTLIESSFIFWEHALHVVILCSLGATVLFETRMTLLVTAVAVALRVVDTTEYSVLLLIGGAFVLGIATLIDISRLNIGIYALFMCLAIATVGYFLKRNYWFIEGMENTCFGILLITSITFAVPGLYLMEFSKEVLFGMIFVQAAVMAQVEAMLYNEIQEDGSTFYPPYLIALTTFCGVQLSTKMLNLSKTRFPDMLIYTVYVSKLSVFLDLDWVKVFVLMCASASKYTILIVLGLLYARLELFDVLFLFTGHRPTDAGLFGSLLCATSALGGFQSLRKARLICMIAGLLLVIIKPPLPWQGEVGFWYDQDHVPDREPDRDSMYSLGGEYDGAEETYRSWFLILSIVFGLFGVGTVSGLCFGLFVMKESVVVCALCGAFVQYKRASVFYAMVLAIVFAITTMIGDEEVYNLLSVVAVCFLHCALSVKYTHFVVSRAQRTTTRNRDDDNNNNKVYNPFVRKRQSASERNMAFNNGNKNAISKNDYHDAMDRVGNIATLSAFVATLVVFWDSEDSSFITIPLVSTILFLARTEKASFFAYVAVVCGYFAQVLLCNSNDSVSSTIFAAFSFPSAFAFARFLYSSFERQYEKSALALASPLNIVPIVMGLGVKSKAVVSLGIVGVASGIAQYVVQSRIQRKGSRYL